MVTLNSNQMETLITHKHAILLAVAVIVRLIIAARRFNRRGAGGLQHFSNYFMGICTLFLELCLSWAAWAVMVWAVLALLFT